MATKKSLENRVLNAANEHLAVQFPIWKSRNFRFNNKGGVGKTSLVYHLSWMYAQQGLKVLAVDLDPQANLTSMFLDEDILENLWPDGEHPGTILGCLRPIIRGIGDLTPPHLQPVPTTSLFAPPHLAAGWRSWLVRI